MAISIKEVGHKAENLIEQGKEAEQEVQSCQAGVANAQRGVAAAQRAVMAASQMDENGNPRGDMQMAQAQLRMAQNILAASQRSLEQAKARVQEVAREKMDQVSEIQEYKEVGKRNLAKLAKLKTMAFSEASAALAGIADRMNEAESARVALLESLGMDAAAEYFDYDFGGGSDGNWSRQYSSLSTSGQLVHQHGGGGKSLGGGSGVGGSYGGSDGGYGGAGLGGVGSAGYGTGGYGDATGAGGAYGGATEYDLIDAIMASPNMTLAEKKEALQAFRMGVLNAAAQGTAGNQEGAQKVLVMSPEEKRARGELYVDRMMDIYRENLIEHGAMEGKALDAAMAVLREQYQGELEKELSGQASGLYNDPNYSDIVKAVNTSQRAHPVVVQGTNMMNSFHYDSTLETRPGQQAAQVQGYLGRPQVLDSGAFQEKVSTSGVIIYRTLNPGNDIRTGESRKASEFADQLIYAEQGQLNGVGAAIYGEGIYFTMNRGASLGKAPDEKNREGARKESLGFGDEESTRTLVAATIRTDMRVGDFGTVSNEYRSFCEQNEKYCERFGGAGDEGGLAAYAISQGYDALHVRRTVGKADYLVVYNRTKLIFPEDGNE